ncbi:MAG: glyoxalase [Rhodospirillaceae bacterium]|nr:glyoxalase [Rhodospirillaceae bacterium]
MTDPTPLTLGAHHIGLTVPDLGPTKSFLMDALGFQQVGEVPDYPAVFVSDGTVMLTLWQAENPETATPFDRRKNIGLHHLALKVADFDALDSVFDRVSTWPGVDIECAPCPPRPESPARHFLCIIPGGLRFEFFAAPQ